MLNRILEILEESCRELYGECLIVIYGSASYVNPLNKKEFPMNRIDDLELKLIFSEVPVDCLEASEAISEGFVEKLNQNGICAQYDGFSITINLNKPIKTTFHGRIYKINDRLIIHDSNIILGRYYGDRRIFHQLCQIIQENEELIENKIANFYSLLSFNIEELFKSRNLKSLKWLAFLKTLENEDPKKIEEILIKWEKAKNGKFSYDMKLDSNFKEELLKKYIFSKFQIKPME